MQVVDNADKILSEFSFLLESGADTKVRLLLVSAVQCRPPVSNVLNVRCCRQYSDHSRLSIRTIKQRTVETYRYRHIHRVNNDLEKQKLLSSSGLGPLCLNSNHVPLILAIRITSRMTLRVTLWDIFRGGLCIFLLSRSSGSSPTSNINKHQAKIRWTSHKVWNIVIKIMVRWSGEVQVRWSNLTSILSLILVEVKLVLSTYIEFYIFIYWYSIALIFQPMLAILKSLVMSLVNWIWRFWSVWHDMQLLGRRLNVKIIGSAVVSYVVWEC